MRSLTVAQHWKQELPRGPGGLSAATAQLANGGKEPQGREVAGSLSKRQCGNSQDAGLVFQEVNLHWRNLALRIIYKELGWRLNEHLTAD